MSHDLVRAVLARPKMYTLSGDYSEVVAFLTGYYSGLARDQRAQSHVERWSLFENWLVRKLEPSKMSTPFHLLKQRYPDRALEMFERYYNEFETIDKSQVLAELSPALA